MEYLVSIAGGQPGRYRGECEPPLGIAAANIARFKIRITDTGYAWNGSLRVTLIAGENERLALPAMRIWT